MFLGKFLELTHSLRARYMYMYLYTHIGPMGHSLKHMSSTYAAQHSLLRWMVDVYHSHVTGCTTLFNS
jgi:hypothetical protein